MLPDHTVILGHICAKAIEGGTLWSSSESNLQILPIMHRVHFAFGAMLS